MSSFNPCSFCNANCCKDCTITVTSFDVVRIAGRTGKKPEEFATLARASILNRDESTVLECHHGRVRHEFLLALRSHPCVFLGKGNRCSIHDYEPYGCRRYPMGPDGKVIGRAFCHPLSSLMFRAFGSHLSNGEYVGQMNSYREIVKKWNLRHGKFEDCMDFLMREAESAITNILP